MENQEGFQIIKSCDPETKGPDIVAERRGILRQVEVKGYPSDKYVKGPKKGQKKPPNQPRLQAKVWFAEVLLALLLAKSKNTTLEISLGLLEHPRYISLLKDTSWARKMMCVHCYLVDESGDVKLLTE